MILAISFAGLRAQTIPVIQVPYVVEAGDTVRLMSLAQVDITAELVFKSKKEKEKYNKLKRDVKKVYPFAILAGIKIREYDAQLAAMKTELERDIYMKRAEKELKKQFGEELKKLTITQGRILIKLVDRETGNSSYALIKNMRGGLSAFMWQSLAVMFNSSLKKEYDAKGDDKMIELIIHQMEDEEE